MPYVIRKASRADVSAVCELVKELAAYENMSDDVKFTPEIFAESVFEKNYARILVCIAEGKIIAYAKYFYTFSTFLVLGGMYLEDLYVQKKHTSALIYLFLTPFWISSHDELRKRNFKRALLSEGVRV